MMKELGSSGLNLEEPTDGKGTDAVATGICPAVLLFIGESFLHRISQEYILNEFMRDEVVLQNKCFFDDIILPHALSSLFSF